MIDREWLVVGARPAYTPTRILIALLPHILVLVGLSFPPNSILRPALFAPLAIYGFYYANSHFNIGPPLNQAGMGVMAAYWSCRVLELLVFVPPELSGIQRIIPENLPPQLIKDGLAGGNPPSTVPPILLLNGNGNQKTHNKQNGNGCTLPKESKKTDKKNSHHLEPPAPSAKQPDPQPVLISNQVLLLEPVPPPFTISKLLWSFDLWTTYRLIGWTEQAPLSSHGLKHPFLRTSSPRAFLVNRTLQLLSALFILDLASTVLAIEPKTHAYFSAIESSSPALADQSVDWRALWSILVVTFTWQSLEVSYVATAISLVALGTFMGWKGAMWEPWGWPPVFGTLKELWVRPGLAMLWSKTWHHYFRRMLVALVWQGLGEKVLGLRTTSSSPPPSTVSTPTPDGQSTNAPGPASRTPSPSSSAFQSPHLRPPGSNNVLPSPRTQPKTKPRDLFSNLVKSLLVFTLTGLLHECGLLSLEPTTLLAKHPLTPRWGTTTLFFVVQPLAIGVEGVVKGAYRSFKGRRMQSTRVENGSSWEARFLQGAVLRNVERLVGFVWTWVWLGWTARWVVEDWSKRGQWSVKLTEWSVIRWVWLGTFWV
ncbi:hypothetical protein T439DRAFT_323925 [Meredithblackwellia eburnea MCA 4105]